MACYIVTYDLVEAEGGDYEELIAAIKAYGTWAHITESTWAIVSDDRAKDVRDHLLTYVPDGSRMFVLKSGSAAAWRNVGGPRLQDKHP